MKPAKRGIDVNLEELDRVLDGARQAPLSEPDYDKLKDALHAMAALLVRSRNTEKTNAVVGEAAGAEAGESGQPDATAPPPAGHGRNRATVFTDARTVKIPHQSLKHGERCPECGQGNVYGAGGPLSRPRTAPDCRSGAELSRRVPARVGKAGRGLPE